MTEPVPGAHVVVPSAVVPVRREPSHRSELVSQWVLGETLAVEAVEGPWMRGRGPGGYVGWTPSAPFRRVVYPAAEWEEWAVFRSLGTAIATVGAGGCLERLPWGARLARGAGGDGVLLPDGRTVSPASPERIVAAPRTDAPDAALPAAPDLVIDRLLELAELWVGVPYLWGGRTELGVDCSGLAQALFSTVGVPLPRDSHQQFTADLDIGTVDPGAEPQRGDLIFFAPDGSAVTHVALNVGGSRILHAASSNGRVQYDDLESNDPVASLLSDCRAGWTRPARR